eukprot:COSAG01_NODE_36909_length_511_cov_0.706311_1_plen_21_part_10
MQSRLQVKIGYLKIDYLKSYL